MSSRELEQTVALCIAIKKLQNHQVPGDVLHRVMSFGLGSEIRDFGKVWYWAPHFGRVL